MNAALQPCGCPLPTPCLPAGVLPESWSALTVLQGLDLGNNTLKGNLPASWGTLANLQVSFGW